MAFRTKEEEGKSRKVEMKREENAGRSESRPGLIIVGKGEGERLEAKCVSDCV